MVNNIVCYYIGCKNSISGQCLGYHRSCGKFCCQEHYPEALCTSCFERLHYDAVAMLRQKAYEAAVADYNQTALAIYQRYDNSNATINGLLMLITCGLSLVIQIPLMFKSKNQRIAAIAEAGVSRPGFAEFYREFAKQYSQYLAIQHHQRSMAVWSAIGITAIAIDDYIRRENQDGFYREAYSILKL